MIELPRPGDRERKQQEAKEQELTAGTTEATLDKAIRKAIKLYESILDDDDSKDSDKIKAANTLIALRHGKDPTIFRSESEDKSIAHELSEAILNSRRHYPTRRTLATFIQHHDLDPTQTVLLENFIKAFTNPTDYFVNDHMDSETPSPEAQ